MAVVVVVVVFLSVDLWRCVQVTTELHHSWWNWTSARSVLSALDHM